jgi:predicted transposase/invertase (TIGR01784 family)
MKISFKHQAIEKNNSPTCSVTEYELGHNLLDMAVATVEGEFMTVAQQIEERGIQQGIQQGIMKMVDHMLSENVEIAVIAKVSGLSLDKIRELRKNKDKH